MRVVTVAGSLILAMAAGAPASAGTLASRVEYSEGLDPYRVFTYAAGPGEQNDITVEVTDAALVVSERDRLVTAGEGCTSLSSTSAGCSLPSSPGYGALIGVHAGDEDDHVVARGMASEPPSVVISGGSGDDELRASGSRGIELKGQPGDDVLAGGAGSQMLLGGAGHDRLSGGRGGDYLGNGDEPRATRDAFHGGSGSDTVSYAGISADVRVDLRNRVGGRPGESDRLQSIESATGGSGDDDLIGTNGANSLAGETGTDHVIGRGGDDGLTGEVTVGGRGDDFLQGPPGEAHCGPGRDRVQPWFAVDGLGTSASPELSQPARRTCEWMVGTGADAFLEVELADDRPRVRLRNPWTSTNRLKVVLYRWPLTDPWYERRAIVARNSITLGPGERRTAVLKLTRAGRRFLEAGSRRVALVVGQSREETGVVLRLRG